MTRPFFDPGEPFRREMQKATAPLRDVLQNAVRNAIPSPGKIIQESVRLSIIDAIRPTVELDLLAGVREEMFASYRESIRTALNGRYPGERTAWADQVINVASALASADAVVVATEGGAVVDDLPAAHADALADEVTELRENVAALVAQVGELARQVSLLVATKQSGSWWSTDRTIALLALLFSMLSFVGDRYDSATEDHTPPPVTAPTDPTAPDPPQGNSVPVDPAPAHSPPASYPLRSTRDERTSGEPPEEP